MEEQEQKYASELDAALKQYAELQVQAADFEPSALDDACQALRPDMEQSAAQRIQQAYGEKYSNSLMQESKREVSRLLNEDTEQPRSVRKRLRQAEKKKQAREQSKKKSRDSWER